MRSSDFVDLFVDEQESGLTSIHSRSNTDNKQLFLYIRVEWSLVATTAVVAHKHKIGAENALNKQFSICDFRAWARPLFLSLSMVWDFIFHNRICITIVSHSRYLFMENIHKLEDKKQL